MASPGSDPVQLLDALTTVLGDDPKALSQRGSDEYDKANGSYFSAFENEVKPLYIAKPATVEQVQRLVEALRPHVIAGSCRIAIRGEGHTPFAGSANVQDGVTIDMRRLKGITLSADRSTVEIAVGETWTTVYTELEKHGLTVAGARVGGIGVAGFILGGGLSMFSTRTGFACDSVVEFKVVLASGQLVRASADENADLWIALRGGLNNFGIVTSITMTTFKAGDIWGGITYYLPGAFPQLLRAVCDFVHNEDDQDVHVMCGTGYGFGHQAASCCMYHTAGKVNAPSLQRFTAVQPQIEPMGTMRTATHLEFCDEMGKYSTNGLRQFWATLTIKPDVALMEMFHDEWQKTLDSIKDAEGFIVSFVYHPLTKALLENSAKAGGNAMDIPPADGPLFVVMLRPTWTRAEDDERIFAAVEALVETLKRLAAERGLLHRYIFTNYGYPKHNVMAGYGDRSLARLAATSEKYDPEGIFQKGVPGGFKLP
ncbi:c707416b-dcfe-49b6-ad34-7f99f2c61f99 [Thermothielavioides terrestris]|uniref:C707416b-dcfe-49b6-ad34-7f99f2c61f99 n=1 Tax=Thermothielavioides terrestris TaxID=2587410 RepID=A0A446BMB9_9PEZI|nr:c707416b-dcfe-49b6-ad34-7f99f2c61f99 [Thermothielavioides terrestris]